MSYICVRGISTVTIKWFLLNTSCYDLKMSFEKIDKNGTLLLMEQKQKAKTGQYMSQVTKIGSKCMLAFYKIIKIDGKVKVISIKKKKKRNRYLPMSLFILFILYFLVWTS